THQPDMQSFLGANLLSSQAHFHRPAKTDNAREQESSTQWRHDAEFDPTFLKHHVISRNTEIARQCQFTAHSHRRTLYKSKRRFRTTIYGSRSSLEVGVNSVFNLDCTHARQLFQECKIRSDGKMLTLG